MKERKKGWFATRFLPSCNFYDPRKAAIFIGFAFALVAFFIRFSSPTVVTARPLINSRSLLEPEPQLSRPLVFHARGTASMNVIPKHKRMLGYNEESRGRVFEFIRTFRRFKTAPRLFSYLGLRFDEGYCNYGRRAFELLPGFHFESFRRSPRNFLN